MARICPLFSGSSGNSTYIRDDLGNGILIDAGVSCKRLEMAMLATGSDFSSLCGIAVTHEHGDHIAGIKTLLKRTNIPLFATEKTLIGLEEKGAIPIGADLRVIEDGFEIGDIAIKRFATSHDCEGSSGYSLLLKGDKKITVCTDLGIVTDEVKQNLKGSDCVLFESNHDVEMLRRGPYPPPLKLRILSDKGHLSNNACAEQLPFLLQNGTTRIILGHLSRQNNLPTLAKMTAQNALSLAGAKENEDYILTVAKPENNGVIAL